MTVCKHQSVGQDSRYDIVVPHSLQGSAESSCNAELKINSWFRNFHASKTVLVTCLSQAYSATTRMACVRKYWSGLGLISLSDLTYYTHMFAHSIIIIIDKRSHDIGRRLDELA